MKIKIDNKTVDVTGKAARVIRQQPGYSRYGCDGRPQQRSLAKTVEGNVRLYVWVSGKWMDASLANITDPSVTQLIR